MPENLERMKDFYAAIIFAVSLLAVTVVVLVFKYEQQRVYANVLKAESQAVHTRAETLELEVERRADIAKRSAEANLERARQAREMLEKARANNALTQKQMIDAMNAQLEREAEAREAAQRASAELIEQRDKLARAAVETRRELEKLQKIKVGAPTAEINRMRKLLKEREDEIARLKRRQKELEELYARAEAAQRRTELEIEERGGVVKLPKARRVVSPNMRSGM